MDHVHEPTPKRIAVAGATGYVGGRLIPELLEDGHTVRGIARRPGKLRGRAFADHPDFAAVHGDVLDASSLDAALQDIDVAYYLVHSLGGGDDFAESDITGARNFATACAAAGVERIVYLSGLGNAEDEGLSEHLRSRHATGDALRTAAVPVTELRAAIIVGSGSASFDIITDLARKLPAMITPRWVRSRCEPIAIRDVTWYLRAVLGEPRTVGETLEIGSGDIHTYEDLMRICAEELGLPFRNITVPVMSPRFSSYWLHLVTRVDANVARPLVEGLRNDVVCTDTRIRSWLPRELSPYRLAVQRALAKEHARASRSVDAIRESSWRDAGSPSEHDEHPARAGSHTRVRLFPRRREFRDYRTFDTDLDPHELYERVATIGGPGGYGRRSDRLWRLRGALDRVVGGPGLRRGRPYGANLFEGDALDWWRVERAVPDKQLRLVAEMRVPGIAHLDFRIEPLDDGSGSRLHQLATLSNDNLWSGLYWCSIAPIHDMVFEELGTHAIATPPS